MSTVIDNVFAVLTPKLIKKFGKWANITTETVEHNQFNDQESKIKATQRLKVSPPYNASTHRMDKINVDVSGNQVLVPVAELTVAIETDRTTLKFETGDAKTYTVRDKQPLYSGEDVAAWILTIRA